MIMTALLLLILAGALLERRAGRRFRAHNFPPGQRVEVAPGRCQHLLCMGERRAGLPTVVFEAGHGAWSSCWQKVMPAIARHTRVCARDRSGYGWSDRDPRGPAAARMVDDLHALLDGAGERGPYLLVGHSMGSSVARLFASRYPHEVTGMVWVDPVDEDLVRFVPVGRWAFWAVAGGAYFGALLARVGLVRYSGLAAFIAHYPSVDNAADAAALVEQVAEPVYLETLALETYVLASAAGWEGTCPHFGSLPVTSLEALYSTATGPAFLAPLWRRYRSGWRAMHDALAARCGSIRRIPVQGGHVIMDEHPQLVIDAICAHLGCDGSEDFIAK